MVGTQIFGSFRHSGCLVLCHLSTFASDRLVLCTIGPQIAPESSPMRIAGRRWQLAGKDSPGRAQKVNDCLEKDSLTMRHTSVHPFCNRRGSLLTSLRFKALKGRANFCVKRSLRCGSAEKIEIHLFLLFFFLHLRPFGSSVNCEKDPKGPNPDDLDDSLTLMSPVQLVVSRLTC